MIDVHGVVGGLVQAVQDADAAPGLGGSGEDRKGECLLVHDLGTTESKPPGATLAMAAAFRR